MKVVAISGMVGTGKTTLCKALSSLTGWEVVQEDAKQNAFLPLFYDQMDRWALASQLSFMTSKTERLEKALAGGGEVILVDRTIQEDFHVFGSVLKKYDIISSNEYELLEKIYAVLERSWPRTDLNIYLEDTDENCFNRVLGRGDAFESKMEFGYIQTVGAEYRKWKATFLRDPYYEIQPDSMDFREQTNVESVLETVRLLLGSAALKS